MIKFIKKYKYHITILIILVLIIGSIIIHNKLVDSNEIIEEEILENNQLKEEEKPEEEKNEIKNVYVDIKGAINKPGVYEIANDKRVIDVVNKAGGLNKEANTSFINLAKKVEDSMVIIIYTDKEIENAKEEKNISYLIDNTCTCPEIKNDACIEKNTASKKTNDTSNKEEKNEDITSISDKININNASLLDLETLPGIGESKAKLIIEYRDTNGSFSTIEDIKNVKGIGDSLYEKIKDYITV